MLALNPRYAATSLLSTLRPRITIEMHFEKDGSDVVYFTSHDDIGRPQGAAGVDKCVGKFTGATQKIDPKNAASSIGSVSFELADIGGAVSSLLAQKNAEGKSARHQKIVFYFGQGSSVFPSEDPELPATIDTFDWLDYQMQFTMIVTGYDVGPGLFSFTAEDVQRLEEPDLFVTDKTTLLETVTAEQLFIPIADVASTPKFQLLEHDTTYTDRPGETVGYVKVEDEVICHNGVVNHATFGPSLAVVERGALNTIKAGHQVDANVSDDRKTKIEEFVYLEGPALKLLYALQTGILYNQGGAVLPEGWHQGIDPALVRLSDYENADPLLWEPNANTGRKLRFEGLAKENGERFISSQILAWLVGIRPVYSDGAIGFKKLNSVLSESSYSFELNNTNIKSLGTLSHRLKDVINTVSIDWDYSFIKKEYLQPVTVIDATSIAKYQTGQTKRFKFKGVKSSNQTDQDLRNIFDAYRNRYAGGGLTLSCEVLPKVNMLEVGDLVRVTTDQLIDPITGLSLDRVFEVQQITPNTKTGRARLSLFASTDAAGEFVELTESNVLDDSFYESQGVNINTVATMSGNVITEDCTLVGGETMGDGIYYWPNDLTIQSDVTVYVEQNVWLRVRGTFTRNGDIIGAGRGHPGGAGGTLFNETGTTLHDIEIFGPGGTHSFPEIFRHLSENTEWMRTNEGAGVPGFGNTQASHRTRTRIGPTVGQDRYHFSGWVHPSELVEGSLSTVDRLPLVNRDGSVELNPLDLRGTSGSGSSPLIVEGPAYYGDTYAIRQNGVDGGNGGAGLMITCRGESVGASSVIDLSGEEGLYPEPTSLQIASNGDQLDTAPFLSNGGSGGGHPGAYYLLVDGNSTFGTSTANVTQNRGLSGIYPGATIAQVDDADTPKQRRWWRDNYAEENVISFGRGIAPITDIGDAGFKVQYIPAPDNINSGPSLPPKYELQPLTGSVSLESGTPQLLGARDGSIRERIRATFNTSSESQSHDYEVQAKESTQPDTAYRTVATVTTGEAFIDVTEGLTYDVRVRVRGVDNSVIPSGWISSAHTAVGKSEAPSDPISFSVSVDPLRGVVLDMGEHPDADFLEFIISEDGAEIYRGNSTQFVRGFVGLGSYDYELIVRDRSGNVSAGALQQQVEITPPLAPSLSVTFRGENYVITATPGASMYAPTGFRLTSQSSVISEFTGSTFSDVVHWLGSRDFEVVALYPAGIETSAQPVTISPVAPSLPVLSAQEIDHQVTLFYQAQNNSLPVKRFDVYLGDTFATAQLYQSKSGDSGFTLLSFEQGGDYTIWVQAADSANNLSVPSAVGVSPTSPADFVLFNRFSSRDEGFSGQRTNCHLDTTGDLLMLADEGETWDEYTSNGYATFQAEHDAGYTLWAQPGTASATYREDYDLGAVISSSIINVARVFEAVAGNPSHTVDIAFSENGSTYQTFTNTNRVFATQFRYVRVTINATGNGDDIGGLTSLVTSLRLKEQGETGISTGNASDSSGTSVSFDKNWLDINSLTVTPHGTTPITAVVDFDDVPNPTLFSVYLFDTNSGARVTAQFSWAVRGYLSNN